MYSRQGAGQDHLQVPERAACREGDQGPRKSWRRGRGQMRPGRVSHRKGLEVRSPRGLDWEFV